jgi:hypothetical protein
MPIACGGNSGPSNTVPQRISANLTFSESLAYHPHRLSRPSSPLARYLFTITIGLERAGRQPCRHPPFGALDQFLDEGGYCITSVVCKAVHFRLVTALRLSHAHLLAINTKMASRQRGLLLGIGQGHRHGSDISDNGYTITAGYAGSKFGMACCMCAPPRGRSGANSSGGLSARWIPMWSGRSSQCTGCYGYR